MPADLTPGSYSFSVRATDKQDLSTGFVHDGSR